MNGLVRVSMVVVAALASVVASDAESSERWTLDDVVARVRTEHPLLLASRHRVASAEGVYVDAGKWPNPRLVFSGS